MPSATTDKILDAAERRARMGGYNGFSFRDLAEDVGVKSASVHHHFPTKEVLMARLAARYTERFMEALAEASPREGAVPAMRRLFRASLEADNQMCLCGMLAAESAVLPAPVVTETRRFFERLIEALAGPDADSETREKALKVVARLEGALLTARVLGDMSAFDAATADLAA
ncbi:MAG: helix-turn-helix domain-containing protein [Pseudomonadota bacterium]